MEQSFTLVIPTYNRSKLVANLLEYLAKEGVEFRIMILDSSAEEHRRLNRQTIAASPLVVSYIEYDQSTPPFDKFRDGVHRVTTPICALCADDDPIIVPGIRACVDHLQAHPDYAAASGYAVMFDERSDEGPGETWKIDRVIYYAPSLDNPDPLRRIAELFQNYQALTYNVYRTTVLRMVFDVTRSVQSILARELLASAVTAALGKVARLRCFTNARSMAPSANYQNWHPLEWLMRRPQELFATYLSYRGILLEALARNPASARPAEENARLLDLIHFHYLVRHVPPPAEDFILDRMLGGAPVEDVWGALELQVALINASRWRAVPYFESAQADPPPRSMRVLPSDYPDLAGTPLIDAVVSGDLEAVRRALVGVDVTAAECGALRVAAALGHLDILRFLHENGANHRALDDQPLRLAAANGQLATVIRLHQTGASLSSAESGALREAARNGHLDMVRYLCENGIDPNAQNGAPAIRAAKNGHIDVLLYLRQVGANFNLGEGAALRAAAAAGRLEMVRFLCESVGVGVGVTAALVEAAGNGRQEVIRYLINRVSDPAVRAEAMQAARRHGHVAVAQIFEMHGTLLPVDRTAPPPPRIVTTPVRKYRLAGVFQEPQPADLITYTDHEVAMLLACLDRYPVAS
ncbi:MAG TPA: TIGR00180 family glycosyltransferase [Azospirillum sp.]